MRRATLYLNLIALAIFSIRAADAAIVTITYNAVTTAVYDAVYDNGPRYDSDSFTGTTIPTTNYLLESSLSADQYAKTTLNYSAVGGQTILDAQFSFSRQGGQYDYSQTYESYMQFTVDADTTYNLSGNIAVADIATNSSGYVVLGSYLYDVTSNVYLAETYQESQNTTDESFVLGGAGGDSYNYTRSGSSLNGSLIAGHEYLWYYNTFTYAYPDADSGATATGAFNLTIGEAEAASVPEPASLVTFAGLGMCAAIAALRKRRKSAASAISPESLLSAAWWLGFVLKTRPMRLAATHHSNPSAGIESMASGDSPSW